MTMNQIDKMAKQTAQRSIFAEYGFKVSLSDIRLLESYYDGKSVQYVRFTVNGHEYSADDMTVEKIS